MKSRKSINTDYLSKELGLTNEYLSEYLFYNDIDTIITT